MEVKELTWKCEACGRIRKDEDISVVTLNYKFKQGGSMGRNTKYCNDSVLCLRKAVEISEEHMFYQLKNEHEQ